VREYQESVKVLKVNARDGSGDDIEQQKKHFMYHLNRSGAYFTLKEELKRAVAGVARECFEKKSAFTTPAELQTFLSELYVFLVDHMHMQINKMFKQGPAALDGVLPQGVDYNGLKLLAEEAEGENVISLAVNYHRERIAMDEENVQGWFDYGTFCLRYNMRDKAEECFREVLQRNPKHIPTLIAFGAMCATQERIEQAHVFLKSAVDIQQHYSLGLAVLVSHHISLLICMITFVLAGSVLRLY